MNEQDRVLIERLNKNPQLRKRMEELLNIVENKIGDSTDANNAEQYVIDELQKMGNDALHCWANNAVDKSTEKLHKEVSGLHGKGKKKVRWNSTFGEINVIEPIFNLNGKQEYRPFLLYSNISSRCCSLPLQRVLTDFGADDSYGKCTKKVKEHYGIDVSASTVRAVTLSHAEKMDKEQHGTSELIEETLGCEIEIAEIDGCMIPIVTVEEDAEDKRKGKILSWKEARLSMAHSQGSKTPKFSATFQGSTDEAGESLLSCAIKAGFGKDTYLHGVGDGASWIANQFEDKFGTQGHYLIDFFHVCEYLEAASKSCCDINPSGWVDEQKKHLKNNDFLIVIENMTSFIEPKSFEENKAPVRACHRYLNNRQNQLDYKGAIEKGLPIGSGEIESAHRYVIQKRLKLSGAWWKASNINPMLSLRVVRENEEWEQYWANLKKTA
jgi:hypothetical protein